MPEDGLLGTSSETMYMEIPDTHVKTVPESSMRKPPELYRKQKKQVEKSNSINLQFFAAVDRRNASITAGSQIASADVCERDIPEVPDVPVTIATTTTPPVALMWNPEVLAAPELAYLKGLHPYPTVTATCRPRTWMQQITEGQINEPRREDAQL